jgi:flavin-dependent dehydrogenase
MKPKIVIPGAGPAGSSLAIRLADRGFPVTLVEREKFPRHKLCGEFISPECLGHFRDLGVLDDMLLAGGDRITETKFYAPSGASASVPSEWFGGPYALSLSRAEMDNRLLQRARAVGVEVMEETSAAGLVFEGETVRGIKIKAKNGPIIDLTADLVIDATGRAGILTKLLNKAQRAALSPKPSSLVGFKAHLKGVAMGKGVCEIYSFPSGYGGLSHVENGGANFCFLIKARAARELNGKTNKIIEEIVFQNARARQTLKDAEPVHEWLAVAVEGFGQKDLVPAANLLSVGDAAAFIDPFTGSGMLMALESAAIVSQCIAEHYANPHALSRTYQTSYARAFRKRLFICGLLRRAAFAPGLARIAIAALNTSDKGRKLLARATRTTLRAG